MFSRGVTGVTPALAQQVRVPHTLLIISLNPEWEVGVWPSFRWPEVVMSSPTDRAWVSEGRQNLKLLFRTRLSTADVIPALKYSWVIVLCQEK